VIWEGDWSGVLYVVGGLIALVLVLWVVSALFGWAGEKHLDRSERKWEEKKARRAG
jgi:hypothetical protein